MDFLGFFQARGGGKIWTFSEEPKVNKCRSYDFLKDSEIF